MPTYRVERYEIHSQAYVVQADSEAEAVKKTLEGLGEVAPDEFGQFEEFSKAHGLPMEFHPELAEGLRKLGVDVSAGFIPSVKSIEAE